MPDSRNRHANVPQSSDGDKVGVSSTGSVTEADPVTWAIDNLLKEIQPVNPCDLEPNKLAPNELGANYKGVERIHYVAVSGGVDSLVLAHALANSGLAIHLLHVNHHRMADALSWQKQCEQLATKLNVPISVLDGSIAQQKNLEANLRQKRYAALSNAVGCNNLWLAHHQDDQAEGFFLRLLRGSGAHGLVSLKRVRTTHGMTLLRPFLKLKKEALVDYALSNKMTWLEDTSNEDFAFRRNIWRHKILPTIHQYFPTFERSLHTSIEILERESSVLDEVAKQWLQRHSEIDSSPLAQPDSLLIDINALNSCSLEKRSIIIRYYLKELDCDMPPLKRLDSFLQQITIANSSAALAIGGVELKCWNGFIYYINKHLQPTEYINNNWFFDIDFCQEFRINEQQYQAHKDTFIIDSGLKGLVVTHPNNSLKHTKLKKLLSKSSVPPWQRSYLPVVRFKEEVIYIPSIYIHPEWRAMSKEKGQKMVYFD